ncbi:MAG: hypothetical protein AOA65_0669 [Candidatus Bathyarchaeota archaeon BA1]|nr:MAG: hypothetical protein AOA65_0669 [Candidatus Bathyarchaeota archaeon BA1]
MNNELSIVSNDEIYDGLGIKRLCFKDFLGLLKTYNFMIISLFLDQCNTNLLAFCSSCVEGTITRDSGILDKTLPAGTCTLPSKELLAELKEATTKTDSLSHCNKNTADRHIKISKVYKIDCISR